MHILPALGLWDEVDDRGNVKPLPSMQVLLSQAERSVFANTNRTVAGENCMFNKAAARSIKRRTTLKPLFFYLWWLQVVLGGTLLSHSSWQLIRCRGLEVNASSHFIYGPSLWQSRVISVSFPQTGNLSWFDWTFDDGRKHCSGAVNRMVYVVDWGFGAAGN